MKRLVYSPSISAWVKTDSGVVDLSPYIVNCHIERKIDDVSSVEIEFRNPKVAGRDGKPRFMFTEHDENGRLMPVFHPMDPITISMERIAGRPVQVFTGYCDTTPDVQLYPGTAKIKASCTLKRLLYTYWDPGLNFVIEFMHRYGWDLNNKTGIAGTPLGNENRGGKLNDASIGNLLYAVLNEVGGWDNSNIYIQPLPDNISSIVSKLFTEIEKDNKEINYQLADALGKLVGSGSYGTSSAGGSSSSGSSNVTFSGNVRGEANIVRTIRTAANMYNVPPEFALAVAIVETGLGSVPDNRQSYGAGKNDWYQWTVEGGGQPYCNNPTVDYSKGWDLGYACSMFCQAAAKPSRRSWSHNFAAWARVTQLAPCVPDSPVWGGPATNPSGNHLYSDSEFPAYVEQARNLLKKYP